MPNSFLLDTCTLVRLAGFPETLSAATAKLHDLSVITTDGNFSKYDITVIE